MLLWSAIAFAITPTELAPSWSVTIDNGVEEAVHGVVVDSNGEVVAVGYKDDSLASVWYYSGIGAYTGGHTLPTAGDFATFNSIAINPDTDDVYACGKDGDDYTLASWDSAHALSFSETYSTYAAQGCNAVSYSTSPDWGVITGGYHEAGGVTGWVGLAWALSPVFVAAPPVTHIEGSNSTIYGTASDISGGFAFAGDHTNVDGDLDAYLISLNSVGNEAWHSTYAGSFGGDDAFTASMAESSIGELVVAGYETVADGDTNWVITRYSLSSVDGVGEALWTKTWNKGRTNEKPVAVIEDSDGDFWVAGVSSDGTTTEWIVVEFDGYDGTKGDTLVVDVTDPLELRDMAFRDGHLIIGGSVYNALGDSDGVIITYEQDRDGDGVADTLDACPDDELKAADVGICGCGDIDTDTDGDGEADCVDQCETDPEKTEPGVCGCGESDVDTDSDGTPDCDDFCAEDPEKIAVGECGCGSPDIDYDGDGVLACRDACPDTPQGEEVDNYGCSGDDMIYVPPTEDSGAAPPPAEEEKKGCQTASGPTTFGWFALLLLAARRRQQ